MSKQYAEQADIDELQSRILFHEDALQEMSDQLADQSKQLRLAQEHIKVLNQKMNELLSQSEGKNTTPVSERPPHY